MSMPALKRMSVAEYLASEERGDVKHEYYDGEAFAMAGGTIRHSLIASNMGAELRDALRARGCRVLTAT